MSPALGRGVYTLREVARYAELSPSTARNWFRGRSDGSGLGPVFHSDFGPADGDFAVSFLDLVDCHVVGQFRRAGVTLPTIRRAYHELSSDLGTRHPFAHSRLYTDGKRVLVRVAGKIHDELLYDAVSRQLLFQHLRDGLERIEYGPKTGLATRWRVASGVIIDPDVNFGKPVVAESGTATFVLARQYFANHENAALVADLYDLAETDVLKAVEFEARYGHRAA